MKKLFIIILGAFTFTISFSQNTDEAAIKQLLEKESATWRSGDIEDHASCWAIKPYSRILVSTADGNCFDVPPNLMIHPDKANMGKGGFAVHSNYKMNINGNNAWVSHDEVSTATDGNKTYSYEIRILEKINGHWKIVGQSIHLYKPKP